MELHVRNGIFWVESKYHERHIPKEAGFLWHGKAGYCIGICPACQAQIGKVWWTKFIDVAAQLAPYADEEVSELLKGLEEAKQESRAADVVDVDEFKSTVLGPTDRDYFPFQRAGIHYALKRDRVLIGDDMGLGKTVQALGIVNALPEARRILILCPASLRINWKREAEAWLVHDWHIQVIEQRHGTLKNSAERLAVIVNYDKLGGKRGEHIWKALDSIEWDVLIADEIHYCKNADSQRAKAVLGAWNRKALTKRGLVHGPQRIVFLTGTPITNRPVELFPLLRCLDPDGLGRNFFKFAERYCNAHKGTWGWNFSGSSNPDELQDLLRQRVMVRRLKTEVLKELPAKRRQVLEFAPNGAADAVAQQSQRATEHEARINALTEAAEIAEAMEDEEGFREAVYQLREAQRTAFEELAKERHRIARLKIPHVVEHVTSCLEQSQSKLLVFAHHKAVVNGIAEKLTEQNIKYVTITGDTPMQKRQDNVDTFQTDPEVRVFIGNIQAAGVGLTLTAGDHVIFAELDWVPANMTQAEDRAHRIGQKNSVLIQYLVFEGSVDARMAETLVTKMQVIDAALDKEHAPRKPVVINEPAKPHKRRYPEVSDAVRRLAGEAVKQLAGTCDGARERDGMGFNRLDTQFGHELAARALARELTNGEVFAARRMVRKYKGQLGDDMFGALWCAESMD
jgi:SWI/SNF-related matrix-associated actin-dependent regulator 1 of chromatin subfamily A